MKKLIFIFILITSFFKVNAQNTQRGVLGGLIFETLYGNNVNLDSYEASNFPNPYVDLQDNSDLFTKIKILSHLRYNDGITCFNLNWSYFYPYGNIVRAEALSIIMEAWNIPPDWTGSSPFNDVATNDAYIGYINKAYDIGLISGTNFNPYNLLVNNDLVVWINNVLNSSYHPVQASTLQNLDNYFIPNNYTPYNLSQRKGLSQGVFSHYAKNSFVIPDRKMSLNFSHFYSTQMVELPPGFFPIKPLSRGWSHTFNSYILEGEVNNDELYTVIWPDGSIHIWNEDNDEYVSQGVYDEFDKNTSTRIYITKKNQVRYKYEKLDSDRDIYYLTEIQDPNGNEINIDYENAEEDDTKRVQEVEAPSGKKLEFQYRDDTDLVERIEDPIGRRLYFDYSGVTSGWVFQYPVLVEFEDAESNRTTYQYNVSNVDEQYLLKRIDLPRGNQIKAEYSNNSKLESYQINNDDPIEVETNFDYENNNITSTVETPLSTGGTFTQDYTFNNNGLVTDYSSDTNNVQVIYPTTGVNVMLPTTANLNGVDVAYEYDNNGNVTKIDKDNGDVVEEFDYDNDNNLIEYTDAEGNVTNYSYDSDENLIEIEDALGNSIFFNYDSYGQLLSQTNQEGITVNYTYETDGSVSNINVPESISSSFSYDGVNRLEERNDNGLISTFQYDDNDNITQTTNSGGYTTTYNYDANDNLSEIINANNISTSFTYDDEDRVIQEQFGNLTTQFDYGDEGYLEETIKPSGLQIDYEYDNDGRLEETGTISNIDYNNENLVDDISNANGTIYLDYDNLNLLDEVTTTHGYDVEYHYEDTGLVDRITYPTISGLQFEVRYDYDAKNRVFRVHLDTNNALNNFIIAEFDYYDDDRLDDIDYGNGIKRDHLYDSAGRLIAIHTATNNNTSFVYQNSLTLNNRGNILQEQESFQPIPPGFNPGSSNTVIGYNYDNNSQLQDAGDINYNVNDDGNTAAIGSDTSLSYDVDDRLTVYTDVDNNLVFKYNPYGQRIEVIRNGVSTKYVRDIVRDNILVDLDEINNPIHYYIYSPSGMLLARMNPDGSLQYYHGDTRGSVVAITDENAIITHQYRYDDFGKLTKVFEPANDTNSFRYVGAYGVEYELNDLYYMRARYYKPSIGRFLSEDPIWSTNLYPYADNNPISRIDPNGELSLSSLLATGVLTHEFFSGQGNLRVIDDNNVALALQDSQITNQARNDWYEKVNSGDKDTYSSTTNYLGKKRFPRGNFSLYGLVSAGTDPIEQFVGSFSTEILSDGDNLTFMLINTTSLNSVSYGIIPNNLGNSLIPNTIQIYKFSEPIDFNRINK